MKKPLLLLFAFLICALSPAQAQFEGLGDVPVEINAEDTRFEGGVAIAEGNVIIRYAATSIYCDYAQYNPDTRDVLVSGNVRIFRDTQVFTGERAVYNLETKSLTAADFRGSFAPFGFAGDTLGTLGANAYIVKEGVFTTSDNSKPDYFMRARTIRIYQNKYVIFSNVKLFIGRTPVFWFPYVYQNLNDEQSFSIAPGYTDRLGAYLYTRYSFPVTPTLGASLRVDLMSERGVAVGLESDWESGANKENWGRFRSYYLNDLNPDKNETTLNREPIDAQRYRVSLQNRFYFTEDIYATVDINKLSDARFLEDFDPGEFRQNPNPDNMIAVTKWDEDYTLTLLGRKQLNEFFDFTERLPELALDVKRQPVFGGSGFFYDSDTSVALLKRNLSDGSTLADYDTFRADTFHQLTYPKTFFDWLSIIPRVGVRGTYYTDSGTFRDVTFTEELEGLLPGESPRVETRTERRLEEGGSVFRPVVNAGLEASFKFSRAYESVQSRAWGLDGLRHVVQPWMNFSYVYTTEDPNDILQFDRLNPSTQRPPIDFPQFNGIDSISNWTVLRLGVRNRFQTRRDNATFSWLELNTFFDINFDQLTYPGFDAPDPGTFSNIYNRLRWTPLPWVTLNIDSQVPLLDDGFTEVNSSAFFLLTENLQFNIGHRYLSDNPLFFDSNLLTFGAYWRVNENWAFSFREQYEFEDSTLESQRYEIHRDLSSWIASLGVIMRDNRGEEEFGLLLTFTLKDLPQVRLPLPIDPQGTGGSGKSR